MQHADQQLIVAPGGGRPKRGRTAADPYPRTPWKANSRLTRSDHGLARSPGNSHRVPHAGVRSTRKSPAPGRSAWESRDLGAILLPPHPCSRTTTCRPAGDSGRCEAGAPPGLPAGLLTGFAAPPGSPAPLVRGARSDLRAVPNHAAADPPLRACGLVPADPSYAGRDGGTFTTVCARRASARPADSFAWPRGSSGPRVARR